MLFYNKMDLSEIISFLDNLQAFYRYNYKRKLRKELSNALAIFTK